MGAREPADSVWVNGRIQTLDRQLSTHSAMAVRSGDLVFVGDDRGVQAHIGTGTTIHDLGGKFAMPGLIDAHTHALWGACRDNFEVFVGYDADLDALIEGVRARVSSTPAGEWIAGGPWKLQCREELGLRPKELLDRVAPDHPVALKDLTQHSLWLNSRALEICGIDRHTPDVPGGHIERDSMTGEPLGILNENASAMVRSHLVPSAETLLHAADIAAKMFNRYGITAIKEPMAFETDLLAYRDADRSGRLTVHLAAHIARTAPMLEGKTPYDEMQSWRDAYASRHINTGFAKLFLDGVAPSRTAAFVAPYLPGPGYDAESHDPEAMLLLKPDELEKEVIELDQLGFVVKMHAIGDRAVQAGLDAIAAARRENGNSGLRHEIAHTTFVRDEDLERFAELDAVAEVSPKLWFPNPVTPGQVAVLGPERTQRCYPIRLLMEAGAELVYGSDWPAAAPDANPWIGLAGMISRTHPLGLFEGSIGQDQKISLAEALPLFTTNAARSMGMEHRIGSLEIGKSADFIVLEKSIFDMDIEELARTQVSKTVFEGNIVHQQ